MEVGLQGLSPVLISFQAAAVRRLRHGPDEQPRHSWQYLGRGRESGEKTEPVAVLGEKKSD